VGVTPHPGKRESRLQGKGGQVRRILTHREVCVMQKATTILSIIQQRGIEQKPLQRVYRLLYHQELYEIAYARIYRNRGATTPGSDQRTLDGMSAGRIINVIDLLKTERYRWQPVRRIYIRKKSGKLRPLGIPTVHSYCTSCN